MAREIGVHKLSAQALVTVNLLDKNDNSPDFEVSRYFIRVRENVKPGTVILKVNS